LRHSPQDLPKPHRKKSRSDFKKLHIGEMNMNENMNKSLVLITGAAGGLGKAFAVEAASRGWDLLLTDLRHEPLEQLAGGLRSTYGVRVLTLPCDLTDAAARAAFFQQIASQRLSFWGLVNVAGTDFEGPFFEQSSQQIRTIIRLNIEGTLDMTHGMMVYRDPQLPFRIINVASLAAFYPMPVKATYAASKRFLMDFSLALGNELRETGASVTVLCPAGLPTTPECIRAIDAQGILGQITTMNTGTVACQTLDAALRGDALCIPGALNRFIQAAGSLIPKALLVELIGWRWKAAQSKQKPAYLPAA
jgi:uncharacterized protein